MTHTEMPIACTLTADEMPKRLAEMQAIGRRALLDTNLAGNHAVLSFGQDGGARKQLEAIVVSESQCCAFLSMTLTDRDDAIELTITAPDGAEPVLAELVAAFTARPAVV